MTDDQPKPKKKGGRQVKFLKKYGAPRKYFKCVRIYMSLDEPFRDLMDERRQPLEESRGVWLERQIRDKDMMEIEYRKLDKDFKELKARFEQLEVEKLKQETPEIPLEADKEAWAKVLRK